MKYIIKIVAIFIPLLGYSQGNCIKPKPNCENTIGLIAGGNITIPISWNYVYPTTDSEVSYIKNSPRVGIVLGGNLKVFSLNNFDVLLETNYSLSRIESEVKLGLYHENYVLNRHQIRLPIILQSSYSRDNRLKFGFGLFAAYEIKSKVSGTMSILEGNWIISPNGDTVPTIPVQQPMNELNQNQIPRFYLGPLLQAQYCIKSNDRLSYKLFTRLTYAYNFDRDFLSHFAWNSYQIKAGIIFGIYK